MFACLPSPCCRTVIVPEPSTSDEGHLRQDHGSMTSLFAGIREELVNVRRRGGIIGQTNEGHGLESIRGILAEGIPLHCERI